MKKYNVAVVGATGNVGREILNILDFRNFPINKVFALASSNSEGLKIIYGNDKEIEVWSEPNKISELKFLLHEGTKVKQIDTIQDWVNIQLENGTLGWIQSSSIKTLD